MGFGQGINVGIVKNVMVVIIIMIIAWTVLADTGSDIGGASGNVSASNSTGDLCHGTTDEVCPGNTYPLTSFFKQKGILLLAMMAGIVLLFIGAFFKAK